MTGGLMQLVATGVQDIYLTGNPMVTYFKLVYRRHTNFAMESISQTFNSIADFGNVVTALISRNGDLISDIYLQTTLPDLNKIILANNHYLRWTDDIGHHLIKSVELDIGGQVIDKHYGDWLEIWSQLTVPAEHIKGYREMIGQDPRTILNLNSGMQRDYNIKGRTIYVPLQFWFCRNIGLALPLIALQYHEVKIRIELRTLSELVASFNADDLTVIEINNLSLSDTYLWVNYIYLDTDERRRFAQVNHEYLIEQLQCNTALLPSNEDACVIDLPFSHPIKELIWVLQSTAAISNGHVQWSNYTDRSAINFKSTNDSILNLQNLGSINVDISTVIDSTSANLQAATNPSYCRPPGSLNPLISAKVLINGNDRFKEQIGMYFNKMQPYNHHTCIPESPGINIYSFALKPESHQPSGACNFSRIDKAELVLTKRPGANHAQPQPQPNGNIMANFSTKDFLIKIYAINYNIFRIMSGMGALAYI